MSTEDKGQSYIATKIVRAKPMTLGQFHETHPGQRFKGADTDSGYQVTYPIVDNKPEYQAWCPKIVFEVQNQNPHTGMSFQHAVEFMKLGRRITRVGLKARGEYFHALRDVPTDAMFEDDWVLFD